MLGGPGSASARVRGGGAVSVTTPPLVPGHSYAWQVRTTDGTAVSPLSATCNFRTRWAPCGRAPAGGRPPAGES